MHYGEMLLSKVVENNDPQALTRFGIAEDHFPTTTEKKVFTFIKDYALRNKGQSPDFRTVINHAPDFHFYENTTDSFDYLSSELKNYSARIQIREFLQREAVPRFNGSDREGIDFAKWVQEELRKIVTKTEDRQSIGISLKDGATYYLEEYQRRKAGDSFKVWKSFCPTLNKHVQFQSGDVTVVFGRSGRGKSTYTMREVVELLFDGATIVYWGMEMPRYQIMTRLYSMVSAKLGMVKAKVNGQDMKAGFATRDLTLGTMSEEFEKGFENFLQKINDIIPGNIYIRAVDDEDFMDKSLQELERDIIATHADIVVLDNFYNMDYAKNTSKTAGGDASETSKKLRSLAGRMKVHVFALTQAEETKNDKGEDGKREICVPTRAEVKKTKSLLEDCSQLLAFDSADGLGRIEIQKSRSSASENVQVEIIYLPAWGKIEEATFNQIQANQFEEIF